MNKYSIDTCGRCAGASDYLGSQAAVGRPRVKFIA